MVSNQVRPCKSCEATVGITTSSANVAEAVEEVVTEAVSTIRGLIKGVVDPSPPMIINVTLYGFVINETETNYIFQYNIP